MGRSCAPPSAATAFPTHGSYREELTAAASPAALLEAIAARTATVADQWQIQIQAGIQARSRVIVHTSYLSDAELAEAHLEQTADVEATRAGRLLDERRAGGARVRAARTGR